MMDLLKVDVGILADGDQEEIVLPVLQEEVFGVAAGDFAAQHLRVGDCEKRRVRR